MENLCLAPTLHSFHTLSIRQSSKFSSSRISRISHRREDNNSQTWLLTHIGARTYRRITQGTQKISRPPGPYPKVVTSTCNKLRQLSMEVGRTLVAWCKIIRLTCLRRKRKSAKSQRRPTEPCLTPWSITLIRLARVAGAIRSLRSTKHFSWSQTWKISTPPQLNLKGLINEVLIMLLATTKPLMVML